MSGRLGLRKKERKEGKTGENHDKLSDEIRDFPPSVGGSVAYLFAVHRSLRGFGLQEFIQVVYCTNPTNPVGHHHRGVCRLDFWSGVTSHLGVHHQARLVINFWRSSGPGQNFVSRGFKHAIVGSAIPPSQRGGCEPCVKRPQGPCWTAAVVMTETNLEAPSRKSRFGVKRDDKAGWWWGPDRRRFPLCPLMLDLPPCRI